jgi:hypothetical protein
MTWTLSISCLSSVVENEENLFERFDKNAPVFDTEGIPIELILKGF